MSNGDPVEFTRRENGRLYRVGNEVQLTDASGNPITPDNPLPIAPSSVPSVEIKHAAISAASAGDNTLVAAVVGARICLLGCVLIASGDVDVRFESGAGGTALSGVMSLAVDGNGFVLSMSNVGIPWLRTNVGELLNLELSAAVQVSGLLTYYEE